MRQYMVPGSWIGGNKAYQVARDLKKQWPEDEFIVYSKQWSRKHGDYEYFIKCRTNSSIDKG
jgi:hypothetical protein